MSSWRSSCIARAWGPWCNRREVSPDGPPARSSAALRTSSCKSMRSRIGPEMRDRYAGRFDPACSGQSRVMSEIAARTGFMAPISWNSAGNSACLAALDTRRDRTREAAATLREPGDRTRAAHREIATPCMAIEISPGLGSLPPPTSATAEAVWWGALNGAGAILQMKPDVPSDCTAADDSASSCVIGGRFGETRSEHRLAEPVNRHEHAMQPALRLRGHAWRAPVLSHPHVCVQFNSQGRTSAYASRRHVTNMRTPSSSFPLRKRGAFDERGLAAFSLVR